MSKKKAQRRGRGYWVSLLSEHETSGLPLTRFAQERGVSITSLHRWRRKLREEREAGAPRFVEVSVAEATQSTPGAVVRSASGVTVEFSSLPPAAYLATLLAGVGAPC